MSIKIALVQKTSIECELSTNMEVAESACIEAARENADLVLFPEIWHNGYPIWDASREDYSDWLNTAISLDDSTSLSRIRSMAKSLELAIAYSFLERRDEKYFNSVVVVDMRGEIVLHQSKVHICAWAGAESFLSPGDDLLVANLVTNSGSVQIGAMICMDREYPETARVLARRGAELLLVPNACDLKPDDIGDLRIAQLRGRAWENFVAIAMTNYPKPNNDGCSMLVYPNGTIVAEAGNGEVIEVVELDLVELRAYRNSEAQMREDRRQPELYSAIMERPKNLRLN